MPAPLDDTPSLASLLTGAIDGRLADVHVALPGKVTAYADGRATVQPLIKRGYVGEDGERAVESLPAIPDVPVMFTGGAGIEVSVEPGDTVLLVFASASLDKWLALDKEVDPGDDRHHTLSDAIAIPGLQAVRASGAQALATKADIDALKDYIATHTHTGVTTGGGTSGAPLNPPPSATGTTRLKGE